MDMDETRRALIKSLAFGPVVILMPHGAAPERKVGRTRRVDLLPELVEVLKADDLLLRALWEHMSDKFESEPDLDMLAVGILDGEHGRYSTLWLYRNSTYLELFGFFRDLSFYSKPWNGETNV